MTAVILAFPSLTRRQAHPASGVRAWAEQHLPLIDAAMDLAQTDDAEFRKRCRNIVEAEGHPVLTKMAVQLDRLAMHIAGLVRTLSLTSQRIRDLTQEGEFA